MSDLVLHTLVEHWNGNAWSVVRSPNMEPKGTYPQANWLFGVTARSSTDVWAVGYWTGYPSGATRSLFEQWNGKRWQTKPGPASLEAPNDNTFNQLLAITTVRGGVLWGVRYQDNGVPSECCDDTLTVRTAHG
jgi:hypothetical protein